MIIQEGLDALQKAELIPDDVYTVKIVAVKDVKMPTYNNKQGCVAKCEIVAADDPANNVPEIQGRLIDYWLVGRSPKGLRLLLAHLDLTMDALKGDTANLAGLTFKGRISSWEDPKDEEWKNQLNPL